jgi:hypothetical protein
MASLTNETRRTIPVSFRLDRALVKRLREATRRHRQWPPGPSQTQIVAYGIDMVLRKMEKEGR